MERTRMEKSDLKIVFLGTPEFAVPSLSMLLEEGYQVAAVVTQPDRPRGRGHKLLPSPVKVLAEEKGLPVYQYERVSREGLEELAALAPDLLITVAFGQILSQKLLEIPKIGCINVHGSLLPKYRGAAPIEWAVIDGEAQTGITTMFTVYELDAGDMLEQDAVDILPGETGGQLRERLSHVGAGTLKRTLEKLLAGTLERRPQDAEAATICRMFPKGFGQLDFAKTCRENVNLIRGLNPAPGAYLMHGEAKIKIWRAEQASEAVSHPLGAIVAADPRQGLVYQCADGLLKILELQYPGGKAMKAEDFLRGKGRDVFSSPEGK